MRQTIIAGKIQTVHDKAISAMNNGQKIINYYLMLSFSEQIAIAWPESLHVARKILLFELKL